MFAQRRNPFAELDVASIRAGVEERARSRARGPEVAEVRDVGRIRLYRPAGGPLPLALYLHRGGWTIGSLDSFDRVCRRLAAGSGCAVAALDHRLAPEHPWPAAVDDTVDALRRIVSHPPSCESRPGGGQPAARARSVRPAGDDRGHRRARSAARPGRGVRRPPARRGGGRRRPPRGRPRAQLPPTRRRLPGVRGGRGPDRSRDRPAATLTLATPRRPPDFARGPLLMPVVRTGSIVGRPARCRLGRRWRCRWRCRRRRCRGTARDGRCW